MNFKYFLNQCRKGFSAPRNQVEGTAMTGDEGVDLIVVAGSERAQAFNC